MLDSLHVTIRQHIYHQPKGKVTRGEKIVVGFITVVIVAFSFFLASTAHANCRTHKCWHRVHVVRIEHSVKKKIVRITPYRCWTMTGVMRSAVPCWIITQESAMVRVGPWRALNTWVSGTPCGPRACGPYQFVGKAVPWPVIVKSYYETLKRMLAHHRMARTLPASAWGG